MFIFSLSLLAEDPARIGLTGPVGPRPGVHAGSLASLTVSGGIQENLIIDHQWKSGNAVRITGDGSVLRNCEIKNGLGNGVEVYASNVTIENCRIHHFLASTFKNQLDAHGITGQPKGLVIRNCEVFYVSGDCTQFDPDRKEWTDVTIENCEFWTGPLPEDAAGFKKGERPGENAFDSKTPPKGARPRVTIRNSIFHGWGYGQIDNMAALNIKENVDVTLENCLFYDNEICIRARGENQTGFGAHVMVKDCAFYDSDVAVRYEDKIEDLEVLNPGWGKGLKKQSVDVGGVTGALTTAGARNIGPIPRLPGGVPAFGYALTQYLAQLTAQNKESVKYEPPKKEEPPSFPEIDSALEQNRFADALSLADKQPAGTDTARKALDALKERARRGLTLIDAIVKNPDKVKGCRVSAVLAGARIGATVVSTAPDAVLAEALNTPVQVPYSDMTPFTLYLLAKSALGDAPASHLLLAQYLADIGRFAEAREELGSALNDPATTDSALKLKELLNQ